MKTKFKIASVIILMCTVGYFQQKQKVMESQLLLLNIEALAYNEGSNTRCVGMGSVDCPINHDKVYFTY